MGNNLVSFIILSSDPQNVIASDEDFSEVSSLGSIDPLLRVSQLQIHIAVNGDENTSIFHSPFELAHHVLAGQTVQEGFRIDRLESRHLKI
ncbi:hypothetical protein PENTCL1PPCAC_6729, partial [Pristionchus entomophagus]